MKFKFPWLWKKHTNRNKILYIPVSQHQEIYVHIRIKVFQDWHKDNPKRSIVDFYNIPLPLIEEYFLKYTGVKIKIHNDKKKDEENFFFVFDSTAAYTMFLLRWS